jgi:hypothetical protein
MSSNQLHFYISPTSMQHARLSFLCEMQGAEAVELMDRASLRSIEFLPGMPAVVKSLPPLAAALLVEFQENKPELLKDKVDNFLTFVPVLKLLYEPVFHYRK